MGESRKEALRVGFDGSVRLEFHGAAVSSDGGLLAYRDVDDALGLTATAGAALADWRTGTNIRHSLTALLRQSVYSRLAGYDDLNDADRLAVDPVMRQVVGGRATEKEAASTSQMARFETDVLTQPDNLAALMNLSAKWIDQVQQRRPTDRIILDLDSSVSETHGQQEGSAYNGYFECTCYHPLFCFNQDGDLERALLRNGNVASADDWRSVLEPVVARYRHRKIKKLFRGDAGFANPEVYPFLETEGYLYAIRLPANPVLYLQINSGEVEASMVDSVTLEFTSAQSLTTSNITLNKTDGGTTAITAYNLTSSNAGKNWTLSFPSSVSSSYVGNSLPDGVYTLSVSVGGISQSFTFYRFYGDYNGDSNVNGTDFLILSSVFGTATNSSDWYLDVDDNGSINGTEFVAMDANFNQHLAGATYSGPIAWNTTTAVPPKDFYYSSNWQVLEEDTVSGGTPVIADQYVWGLAYIDEMVLRDRNNGQVLDTYYGKSDSGLAERLYVEQDANWNTTALIWPDGTLKQQFIYDPYGNATALSATGGAANDAYNWVYLHQGTRRDPVTGLDLHRWRDYSATLGRWAERDPEGYINGQNLYLYETVNPVRFCDPLGKAIQITLDNGVSWNAWPPTASTLETLVNGLQGCNSSLWRSSCPF